jgi:AraC-like DNA-binding protein
MAPAYLETGRKVFMEGEKHVTRVCRYDVLILMEAGRLYFSEDGEPVELGAGEYYIQRRERHQLGVLPSSDARYHYIHFVGEYSEGEGLALSGVFRVEDIQPLCGRLVKMQITGDSYVERCALFYRILSHLYRDGFVGSRHADVTWLALALAEQPSRQFDLSEIAAHMGYSKNRTIQLFKQQTGMTPYRYVQRLRLDAAVNLLENSSLSVGAIAEACGFGSYVNFYKAYVGRFGRAPLVSKKKSSSFQDIIKNL